MCLKKLYGAEVPDKDHATLKRMADALWAHFSGRTSVNDAKRDSVRIAQQALAQVRSLNNERKCDVPLLDLPAGQPAGDAVAQACPLP